MSKKVLTVLLILSVTANLLIIGMIAGRLLAGPPPRPFPNHLGWLIRDADSNLREQLRPLIRDHAQTSRPLRRELAEVQRELMNIAQEDPFDADQLADQLAQLREVSLRYQEASHSQMVEILKVLPPEQRAEAFKRLNQRQERQHRRNGAPGSAMPGHERPGHERPRPGPAGPEGPPPGN